MYLKKEKRKNGRINLSIYKSYRDPITKRVRTKSIKNLGFLDELEMIYDDPIFHFENVAKIMTEEERISNAPISLSLDQNEVLSSSPNVKNLGFICLSKFLHLFKIDYFWNNRQKTSKKKFNLNHIFQFLVFLRALDPGSKRYSNSMKDSYLFDFDFELHDIYRALSVFNNYKRDFILHLHNEISVVLGERDLSSVFYDVTNYYFEIPYEDDFRKKGVSKEHRPNPIIQMGLLMDSNGLPISYELFNGNKNDSTTLMPTLHNLRKDFNLGRVVVVADKGINCGYNIAYNIIKGNGYIFSQSVRGATRELKDFVTDEDGYRYIGKDFKIKSRVVPTEIYVTDQNGKKKKVIIDQKQVAFYSKRYDIKAKNDRDVACEKAIREMKRGIYYPPNSSYKYIKSDIADSLTGEVYDTKRIFSLDYERIKEEEKFDGYYLICTSELDMPDSEIVERYKGLWKIEESFKVTKTELETRPVNLSRKDRIEAHFLICFTTLFLLRVMEFKLDNEMCIGRIIKAMNDITATHVDENVYCLNRINEDISRLGDLVNVDFSKKFKTRLEIYRMISSVKKV